MYLEEYLKQRSDFNFFLWRTLKCMICALKTIRSKKRMAKQSLNFLQSIKRVKYVWKIPGCYSNRLSEKEIIETSSTETQFPSQSGHLKSIITFFLLCKIWLHNIWLVWLIMSVWFLKREMQYLHKVSQLFSCQYKGFLFLSHWRNRSDRVGTQGTNRQVKQVVQPAVKEKKKKEMSKQLNTHTHTRNKLLCRKLEQHLSGICFIFRGCMCV